LGRFDKIRVSESFGSVSLELSLKRCEKFKELVGEVTVVKLWKTIREWLSDSYSAVEFSWMKQREDCEPLVA
jgi:hypothetical protein